MKHVLRPKYRKSETERLNIYNFTERHACIRVFSVKLSKILKYKGLNLWNYREIAENPHSICKMEYQSEADFH